MATRLLTFTLVIALATPAFAQLPSIRRAIQETAAATQISTPTSGGANKGMVWGGVSMIAAGGTLAALGATALKNETCGAAIIGFSVIGGCVEETNKALLWTGIGIAAGGATLAVMGANRTVHVGPNRLAFRVRF